MNAHNQSSIRRATAQDGDQLAKLIDIAGEGIPSWLWSRSCGQGQTPLEVGSERARRSSGGFSFANALVTEQNGAVIGMILSYPIDTAPEENPGDQPAPIAPFIDLEKHSIGTWYINALSVFAGDRGRGVGRQLIWAAEQLAKDTGYSMMSIQVYEQNTGAGRLYKRLGYEFARTSPVRLHPCQPCYTGNVVLLVKALTE